LKPTTSRRQAWFSESKASCVLEPTGVEAREQRDRLVVGDRPRQSRLDARRRDGGGRVDPPPCAVDQHLGPRVRVGLAHDEIPAARVDLAALVAGDDARGNPGGPHQHRERAREVLAEAAARLEQEPVDRVAAEKWRGQRVDERLVAEPRERGGDERAVVGVPRAELVRECDGSRVAPRRQAQRVAAIVVVERRERVAQHRELLVADHLRDGRARDQLLVARQHRVPGGRGGVVDGGAR
jgi:hypothetical protein